ncbi:hypothetical protein BGZ63DRAFT_422763 [Mariannaea sp. PMI_226]|nr:hypothetical protein BGZ63DRAFT_422763 [Mariannaea sp. PMI_226]
MAVLISLPALPSKATRLVVAILVVILFIHTRCMSQAERGNITITGKLEPNNHGPSDEEQYLIRLKKQYGLTSDIAWTARRVRSFEQGSELNSVTYIDATFHSNKFHYINVATPNRRKLVTQELLDIAVPESPCPRQVDASDFLFAVSTTYEQVMEHEFTAVKDWARWMTGGNKYGNGATFILILDMANDLEVSKTSEVLKFYGIDAYVTSSTAHMSAINRYLSILQIIKSFSTTLASKGKHKKWYGILDDKIFLPNLSYLQQRLFSYNSNNELYVGLPSERSDWAIGQGYATTYGGGAVFLTSSAVSRIVELPCYQFEDKGGPGSKRWDSMLQDCVSKHTKMTMRVLPSFYSPSDNDNYSKDTDSYETGIQPLTLHHSDERHQLNPSVAHLVTDACGEACFLRRYRFRDNWVLVNGYTITEYPDGMNMADMPNSIAGLSGNEQAQNYVIGPVSIDEDSIRRKVLFWTGRRNVWRLVDSARGNNGDVWQAYVKRGAVDEGRLTKRNDEDIMDSVIVLIWEAAVSALQ